MKKAKIKELELIVQRYEKEKKLFSELNNAHEVLKLEKEDVKITEDKEKQKEIDLKEL